MYPPLAMASRVHATLVLLFAAACGGGPPPQVPSPDALPPPAAVGVRASPELLVEAPADSVPAAVRAEDPGAGCRRGDIDACVAHGLALRGSVHVRTPPSHNIEALALFEKACAADHPRGCEALAEMLQDHASYVPTRDDPEARVRAWDKACTLGNEHACYRLGFYYWEGLTGGAYAERGHVRRYHWPQDRARGLELMRRGCSANIEEACAHLKEATSDR
jgi:hypothetical protein